MTNEQILEDAEGFRSQPYRCSSGKETIGIGRCFEDNPFIGEQRAVLRLDKGRNWIEEPMTHDEAVYVLRGDIGKSIYAPSRELLTLAALDRLPRRSPGHPDYGWCSKWGWAASKGLYKCGSH